MGARISAAGLRAGAAAEDYLASTCFDDSVRLLAAHNASRQRHRRLNPNQSPRPPEAGQLTDGDGPPLLGLGAHSTV